MIFGARGGYVYGAKPRSDFQLSDPEFRIREQLMYDLFPMLKGVRITHALLASTSLAIVGIALLLPLSALGQHFGFVPPPGRFYFFLGLMVLAYLLIVEWVKQGFYRWYAARKR